MHGSIEFRGVDCAEFVGSHGGRAEIGGEDGLWEGGYGVVEEGFLLGGFDGIEFGEGEADESVGLRVSDEGAGDGGGEFDSLVGDGCTANIDGVGSNVACGAGAISVRDAVGCSR